MKIPKEGSIQACHISYAKRHRIASDTVAKSKMLSDAAEYESLIEKGLMTLIEARRGFVEEYPKTNTMSCICKSQSCFLPCKLSALRLITDPTKETKK